MGLWTYTPPAGGLSIHDDYCHTRSNASPEDRAGNVRLTNQAGDWLYLWVHDLSLSFAMKGSRAQSRTYREFFPHQISAPILTLQGVHANQFQAQRLAEFVHETHVKAVAVQPKAQAGALTDDPTITLELLPSDAPSGRNLKGPHRPITVYGYIARAPRGAKRFDFAPIFSLDFVVAYSYDQLFGTGKALADQLMNLGDFVKKLPNGYAYEGRKPVSQVVVQATNSAQAVDQAAQAVQSFLSSL